MITRGLTAAQLGCLRAVERNGGCMGHSDPEIAPFCDDNSTMNAPDVFNQCHDVELLVSSHDDRDDTSYVHITPAGRAALEAAGREK